MASTFKRELARFDSDRVLPAWDGLLAKQQNTLESLGVPTMFSTTAKADREVGHIVFSREFTISSSPRLRVLIYGTKTMHTYVSAFSRDSKESCKSSRDSKTEYMSYAL